MGVSSGFGRFSLARSDWVEVVDAKPDTIDRYVVTISVRDWSCHGLVPVSFAQCLLCMGIENGKEIHRRVLLIVTAHEQVAPTILPAIYKLQRDHPHLGIKFVASGALLKLEYGQAHVAIRTGPKPDQPDNVVQPFCEVGFGLFAHDIYLSRFGLSDAPQDLTGHTFICWDPGNPSLPFAQWLRTHIKTAQIKFETASQHVAECAVAEGIGIGFCARQFAARCAGLSEINSPLPEWSVPLWLVTHVDLHRTAKVQVFLSALKSSVLPF